jgi:uncharacterized protein YebE (UPF0316 family)
MSPEIVTMIYIFFARILDQSIGTIRIILVSKGYRYIAPIFGFAEVLIWLTAINQALQHLDSVYSYLIYAGGFATGNFVGMLIEARIPIGYKYVQIITGRRATALPLELRDQGFGVTTVDGKGMKGDVFIIHTIIPKRRLGSVLDVVNILEPGAFVTIEDVRPMRHGFISRRSLHNPFWRSVEKKR